MSTEVVPATAAAAVIVVTAAAAATSSVGAGGGNGNGARQWYRRRRHTLATRLHTSPPCSLSLRGSNREDSVSLIVAAA